MVTAVAFYDVAVFFHILAVVLAFGPTFAYAVFFAAAGQTGPQALVAVGRAVVNWGRTVQTLSLILILVTGLYLTEDGSWEYGEFFISWGMAAILILFALAHGFFIPRTRRFVEHVEVGEMEQAQKLADGLNKMGPVAGILVVLTIYVMTAKPFL